MEFTSFVRIPFTVDAVEITADNIAEVAQLVGELRTKGDTTFIALDRRVVPNVNRAYVGWFMTKLGDNYRCYSPKAFKDQFTVKTADAMSFIFSDADDEFDATPPHGTPRPSTDAVYQGE